MNTQTIEIRIARRVATVWLARERVRNALDETTIAELDAAFAGLGADDGVRAIVLAGRGPAFCAGADLEAMRRAAHHGEEENRRDALRLASMLRRIAECGKPVVARVHGDAFAGGLGLVAACDIAFGASGATFCLSETRLGLVPATISPYVVRAIGERSARRYVLSAERFDATEALRIGLLHQVAAPDRLDAAVDALLETLLQTSPAAVASAKDLIRAVAGRPIDDALVADTAERIAQARASDDGREGIQSFLQKRKPRWVVQYEAERLGADDDEEM
ncbi:MAG TPA: enoyl-CoA hydratase/isomerase family protein [Burkholderiaceae bacterium]|nr:enoyl-CoA hydratase/isomerase family protein [Burkholderiaceae bacterium]